MKKFAHQCLFEIIKESERHWTIQWLEVKDCQVGKTFIFEQLDGEWTITKVYSNIKKSTKYVRIPSRHK